VQPDERQLFSLPGAPGQLLAALDRRVLILKTGFEAGLPLRVRAHSFFYEALEGLRIKRGAVLAVVWLDVEGYVAPERQIWQSADAARDPFRAPNAFPVPLEVLERGDEQLACLREAIEAARGGTTRPASFVGELERLAALHETGALTDEEFEQAKRRLLR
jgi:hypothetical protein